MVSKGSTWSKILAVTNERIVSILTFQVDLLLTTKREYIAVSKVRIEYYKSTGKTKGNNNNILLLNNFETRWFMDWIRFSFSATTYLLIDIYIYRYDVYIHDDVKPKTSRRTPAVTRIRSDKFSRACITYVDGKHCATSGRAVTVKTECKNYSYTAIRKKRRSKTLKRIKTVTGADNVFSAL